MNKPKTIDIIKLEEVKKEWEDAGYKWLEDEYKIELIFMFYTLDYAKNIYIDKINKNYCCFEEATGEGYESITLKEHIRLTKTFKALGWEIEDE